MKFDVRGSRQDSRPVPHSLSTLPAPPASPKTPHRTFALRTQGRKWYINDYNFHDDMHAVMARVTRGSREVWELRNEFKSMPHPMHLHGFQFRVIARRGSPPQVRALAVTREGLTSQDLGYQDTVLVWPGESVMIAIDFSQPFTGDQRYMFHCHNLEHEDQGMMLAFALTDRTVPS